MVNPETHKGAAATAPLSDANGCEAHSAFSILLPPRRFPQSRHDRRRDHDFVTGGRGLLVPRPAEASEAGRRIEATASPREAWVAWLEPRFGENASAYFTGTYCDDYGVPHGCMLARNVHKDFRRFLVEQGLTDREFITGVEHHRYRDVLHVHGIIGGPFTDVELRLLKASWAVERGHARVLPVLDGCASYVTKYALKGDTESFDWNVA